MRLSGCANFFIPIFAAVCYTIDYWTMYKSGKVWKRKGCVEMANRVTIRLAGQNYTMLAEETEEYMNEVAELAQQTLINCGGAGSFASTRAMALALVNLADEFLKAKRIAEAAVTKCKALESENASLRALTSRSHPANHHK